MPIPVNEGTVLNIFGEGGVPDGGRMRFQEGFLKARNKGRS